ncbi:hypothetical protein IFM58399_00482 [Aspergillus lentulus]|uniref:Uncharacterized protein n=1 Tax=Aspergillus lentulus TaxID=293939 RepID=A0ABQ1A1C5_ASPLE|nr:uncharacterized protein IFM58399_00482 [Aspergillus lentulus]GFF23955.1 hypothetical protein IFM58399_00482 [Aspergillus lentulus]GFF56802.1 hypothetical protein IFM62136_03223 [Aspergillus lentulus]GFF71217.1 hypothetical protein IFM60648_03371 [Aspergillus lentulus]GFF89602.1 hypothetical protein IFM47457_08207 [Aspergillus lentulus]GFG10775.1 hypothetical protein IFM61392_06569 [Aspergillus lentulus]
MIPLHQPSQESVILVHLQRLFFPSIPFQFPININGFPEGLKEAKEPLPISKVIPAAEFKPVEDPPVPHSFGKIKMTFILKCLRKCQFVLPGVVDPTIEIIDNPCDIVIIVNEDMITFVVCMLQIELVGFGFSRYNFGNAVQQEAVDQECIDRSISVCLSPDDEI